MSVSRSKAVNKMNGWVLEGRDSIRRQFVAHPPLYPTESSKSSFFHGGKAARALN